LKLFSSYQARRRQRRIAAGSNAAGASTKTARAGGLSPVLFSEGGKMNGDQAAKMLVCICGATADQHQGKDHAFIEKAPAYDPATWLRGARFRHEALAPAAALYITVEDRLRVLILNTHGTVELDFNLRLQRPDGQVIPLKQGITTSVSSVFQTFELDLAEGFLLDLLVSCVASGVKFGEIFAVVQLIRGTGNNAIPVRTLITNYVASSVTIGWPDTSSQSLSTNMGAIFEYNTTNPAAGADWTFVEGLGTRIQIISIRATFVTSAAGANRIPHLQVIDTNANVVFEVAASAAQVAATTVQYSWTAGVQPTSNDGAAIAPIPSNLWLILNTQLKTVTTAIQAGDQWSNIRIYTLQLAEA